MTHPHLRRPSSDEGLTRLPIVLAVLIALLGLGTGAVLLAGADTPAALVAAPAPHLAPAVQVAVVGATGDTVPWQQPLSFSVTHGTIISLTATGPTGPVEGVLTGESWTSSTALQPGSTYTIDAQVIDGSHHITTIHRTLRTAAATHVLHATVTPQGGVYGVGQPLIVRFDQKVRGAADRQAVLDRLRVMTEPAVVGAWRWYNSFEVHYRPATYWRPGTSVSVTADLTGLQLPGTDVYGTSTPATGSFTVGRSFIGIVDVTAHTMTVSRDGVVVRTMKVSTGRLKYPTKGGVHIVLLREREHLYNSATVGIPTSSPDGYYEKLPWSVRISNGGAFVHANPATVRYQGRLNVSHGCVNMSVTDAKWFYDNSLLGDVVDVIHAAVPPLRTDAGMSDWNYPWAEWQAGNLTG